MPKYLKLYLIWTGIPALLALAFPSLVVVGFFLLIIPGLILSFAPTAFLWGCIYAAAHWLVRSRLGPKASALASLLLTAAALWAVPQPSNIRARAALAQYAVPPLRAAGPIKPAGDIRLESASPRWDNPNRELLGFRPYSCDNRCLALLFEPGVASVTMNTSAKLTFAEISDGQTRLTEHARTYRLLPKAECQGNLYKPDLEGRIGQFGKSLEDNRAISAEWDVRLTNELCLTSQPPIARYDLLLRTGRWQEAEDRDESKADADYAEVRGGANQLLMRVFNLRTQALVAPLSIEGKGFENFHFEWGRQQLPRGVSTSWEEPGKQLDAALAVRREPDRTRIVAATRAALQAAVADQALTKDSPIFNSLRNYLELLEKQGATPADLPLVERLIADARLDDLDGAWLLPKVFEADELGRLRPAIIAKIGSLPVTADPRTRMLGRVLEDWPGGTFAQLSADESRLLADAGRRRRANGLIARLSDMGTAGAPLITEIVDTHRRAAAHLRATARENEDNESIPQAERSHGGEAHRNTADAAVSALCRLGPDAKGELGRLLAIEQRFAQDGFGARNWDRMMVRVGKPVEQVRKPENLSGSEANYQRNLRHFLDRFRPEQSCS